MAKKSRKVAARYSQLSKEGKKKQRNKSPEPVRAAPASRPREAAAPAARPARAPITAAPKQRDATARAVSSFGYVRSDLRTIGILTGAVVLLLIVLTFVLG